MDQGESSGEEGDKVLPPIRNIDPQGSIEIPPPPSTPNLAMVELDTPGPPDQQHYPDLFGIRSGDEESESQEETTPRRGPYHKRRSRSSPEIGAAYGK